jgi:hypothetical protein
LKLGHSQRFKRVNVNAAELFALVSSHMNVPWRVVADPPKQNVSAAPDASHKFVKS